jgi:hypothetical protein
MLQLYSWSLLEGDGATKIVRDRSRQPAIYLQWRLPLASALIGSRKIDGATPIGARRMNGRVAEACVPVHAIYTGKDFQTAELQQ